MANPNEDPTFENLLRHLQAEQQLDPLKEVAKRVIQDEVTCGVSHFKRVLDFPGISPENREDCALLISTAVQRLKESIFKLDIDFEQREKDIEGLKNLLLSDKSKL